jgi:hypothetical protein
LDSYEKDKKIVLANFLDLMNESITRLNNSDLLFSTVIPEFYDGLANTTPSWKYRGELGYTYNHLLRIMDRRLGSSIIVMSYRNFAKGPDGSIDISRGEILDARGYKTKVILAQETGDVEPPYITFHKTSKNYYNKQINLLVKEFSPEKSYGGIAIHYANSFALLK